MPWYVTTLILECTVEGGTSPPIVEEQLRLVQAMDADGAHALALEFGREEEQQYENPYGETVSWKFLGLSDLAELLDKEVSSGIEVASARHSGADASSLVVSKERLTAFRSEQHGDANVAELADSIPEHDIAYLPAGLISLKRPNA